MSVETPAPAAVLRQPTRDYRTPLIDNRHWEAFRARPDDIIVATFPKVGTTWTQRIIDMLIWQSTAPRPIQHTYPWLDATFLRPLDEMIATLDAQEHRRMVKSHAPLDALPIYEGVKYVHVARDGRDACFSMHNHQLGFTGGARRQIEDAAASRAAAGPPPPPKDPRDYYLQWIEGVERGTGLAGSLPFFEFETTYWDRRAEPQLLLVHYNDLKADLVGEIRRISQFLAIDTPEDRLAEFARAAEFKSMKAEGRELLPEMDQSFDRGSDRFLNQGVNGRWRDALTAHDIARYDALVVERLPPKAAAWIEHGRLVAGDPRTL
jgi:aryl sulfotransferase